MPATGATGPAGPIGGIAWGEATGYAQIVDGNAADTLDAAALPTPPVQPAGPAPDAETETCPMCAERVHLTSMIRWRTSPTLIGYTDAPVYSCTGCHAEHKDGAPVLVKGSEWSVRKSGIFRAIRLPMPSKPPAKM